MMEYGYLLARLPPNCDLKTITHALCMHGVDEVVLTRSACAVRCTAKCNCDDAAVAASPQQASAQCLREKEAVLDMEMEGAEAAASPDSTACMNEEEEKRREESVAGQSVRDVEKVTSVGCVLDDEQYEETPAAVASVGAHEESRMDMTSPNPTMGSLFSRMQLFWKSGGKEKNGDAVEESVNEAGGTCGDDVRRQVKEEVVDGGEEPTNEGGQTFPLESEPSIAPIREEDEPAIEDGQCAPRCVVEPMVCEEAECNRVEHEQQDRMLGMSGDEEGGDERRDEAGDVEKQEELPPPINYVQDVSTALSPDQRHGLEEKKAVSHPSDTHNTQPVTCAIEEENEEREDLLNAVFPDQPVVVEEKAVRVTKQQCAQCKKDVAVYTYGGAGRRIRYVCKVKALDHLMGHIKSRLPARYTCSRCGCVCSRPSAMARHLGGGCGTKGGQAVKGVFDREHKQLIRRCLHRCFPRLYEL